MARVRAAFTDDFIRAICVQGGIIPRHRVVVGLSTGARLVSAEVDELKHLLVTFEDPMQKKDGDITIVIAVEE